jgi:teichuronic acid biosynthesis glycosyltransferase TuaG
MNDSLVSVIMPVFNSGKYLEQSVHSVINQTYKSWELWLADDASTDGSKQIMQRCEQEDARIRCIYLNNNVGAANARNVAINKAGGRFIAFLDSDDLWKAEKLETQVKFMHQYNSALSHTYYNIIDENGNESNITIKAPLKLSYKQLLKNNTIGCLTAMYDVNKTGKMFMPNIKRRHDYGLWLDLLKKGFTAHCIPQSLALYRRQQSSLSANKINVLKYNWQILREQQKLPLIKSTYYFSCFIINKTFKYIS